MPAALIEIMRRYLIEQELAFILVAKREKPHDPSGTSGQLICVASAPFRVDPHARCHGRRHINGATFRGAVRVKATYETRTAVSPFSLNRTAGRAQPAVKQAVDAR
jgi:hypothetical protein